MSTENCTSCNSNNNIVYYPLNNSKCITTIPSCSNSVDASCTFYTSYNLTSIGVNANDSLQDALISINTVISEITGINWGDFNYYCIDDSNPINTAQEFVEAISQYVCDFYQEYSEFVNTTYTDEINSLQTSITSIESPELISCTSVGIINTDTYSQILTKILTNLCSINSAVNPSAANWNAFSVVSPLPTNLVDAFNIVIGWIEDIENNPPEAILPLFDTRNTCLSNPQEDDTLYDTVVKLIEEVCSKPDFDIDLLTWQSCITNPNVGGGADLTSTLNEILQKLNVAYSLRVVQFDPAYFTTSFASDSCSGYEVSIRNDIGLSDSMVALNISDTNPNFLLDKMLEGTNIEFDIITSPGEVIVNCLAEDVKVKASAADAAADYLINKIDGKSDTDAALNISESYNSITDKVDLTPAFDWNIVAQKVMEAIAANNDRTTQFCALSCGCQPCPDGDPRTISASIQVMSGTVEFSVAFDQASPLLDMYNSGNITATGGTVINTGAFTVTSASIPVNGTLTVTNNDSGASLPYNIYVRDENGDPVPGSTSQTGSIPLSSSLTINPFTYGSVTNMIVYIELGTPITTTSSTTTTTTTL